MHAQDSSDPTGITGRTEANATIRARTRKSNAALQMALAGATWDEIARALGYPTPRMAKVSVEKALERNLQLPSERDKMRHMAGLRLDRLLRSVWPTAINPDAPDQYLAISKARDIIADHRRLYGLDAPTEVVVHNPSEAELLNWVTRVLANDEATVTEYDIIDGEILEVTDGSGPDQEPGDHEDPVHHVG